MPDADPTPQELADRLTEPQRRALLWLPADGAWRFLDPYGAGHLRASLQTLKQRGLAETGRGWQATPLGQQVRAALTASGLNGGGHRA